MIGNMAQQSHLATLPLKMDFRQCPAGQLDGSANSILATERKKHVGLWHLAISHAVNLRRFRGEPDTPRNRRLPGQKLAT
jgi:hypothetical protein